mmetsp:Transcript_28542/g.70975  ORF Transcript_28542/g.70975 Transcript_28542/m.70975 type:complete len:259 (+) Transcript_28542:157-933(+)
MVKDGNGIQRGGVVMHHSLVAARVCPVDGEVPPPPRRAAVRPVRRVAHVCRHRVERLPRLGDAAEAQHPRGDLLVPRRVPRELGAVGERHVQPHRHPLLDDPLQLRRLLVPPFAPQIGEHQLEHRAHHQPPLRRAHAAALLLRPRVAAPRPHGARRRVGAAEVPLPRRAPREGGGVPPRQPVEHPVDGGDVRVVVRTPRLERVVEAPAVHPRAAARPAAAAHLREARRGGGRRAPRGAVRVLHLVRPVEQREAHRVVG